MKFRIGNGYDIHRLVEGRNLIIGGITLQHPENLGLDGHSDADVLSHSIMDALLGALSLGDIGKYFPPSDEQWKNADSLFLLSKVTFIFSQVILQNGSLFLLLFLPAPISHLWSPLFL